MQVWKDKTPIRNLEVGRVSSVGIAIRYGLEGRGGRTPLGVEIFLL